MFVAFLLLAPCLRAVAEDRSGVLSSGETISASITSINSNWRILLQSEDQQAPRQIAAADLAWWGEFADNDKGVQVLFASGGWLVGRIESWDAESVTVDSDICFSKIPLEAIAGLIFHPPADRVARDQLRLRLTTAKGRSDRVLFTNGDELECVLLEAQPQFNPPYPRSLQVRPTGAEKPVTLPGERVQAVILNPALAKAPAEQSFQAVLGFNDGSLLYCSQVSTEGRATVTLAGQGELKCYAAEFTSALNFVQPLGGKTTWLSDLPPAAYRHTPFLDLSWPYHLDRNTLGGALRTESRLFLKGVGMHSRARLAFPLEGRFQRFEAMLAIDRQAGRFGSAQYRVYLNQEGKWSAAYQSPVVRGGQPPLPISIDVKDAAAMLLIVDFADRGDELDYANWLNARLR